MNNVTISIQNTNNDTIIKFLSNSILINGGSREFNNIDEAKNAPLVQQLFHLPFVKKIFITANFIAIQRYDIIQWEDVQEEVRTQIEAYLQEGNLVVEDTNTAKKPVEVYAEITPNPSVMKFGSNKSLTTTNIECKNIDDANLISPLAQELFNFPFVKEVFISENYVSVTKFDIVQWEDVYPEIRTFIRSYLQKGKEIVKKLQGEENKFTENNEINTKDLDETSAKIISILNEYIKPAVASDGGNITFKSYDKQSKIVSVVLQGACSGCPSSTVTLKNGIETMLKDMLPNKIDEVIAING